MKKERYYLIDLFKLLGAILVVCIHTIATGGRVGILYSFISKILYGLPVPFFFVCSGFFIGNKILKEPNNIKTNTIKYIKRLIVPFIFWCLISSVFVFDFIGGYKSIHFWIEFFQKLFFSPWSAMWYVSSLIIAILILYLFIKHKKIKELIIFSIIMYIFSLICGNYHFLIKNTFLINIINNYKKIFITTRNGLF
ncbi:MAG: acyltransferase family protein, partial [Bacilli bacterium]|nr:acyltransferase family protein [Bacilli bacterium]